MLADVARRPGYHNYFQPPEDIQAIIRNQELRKLSTKVERLQGELDSLDNELHRASKPAAPVSAVSEGPAPSSLRQWLAQYGEPSNVPDGWISTFEKKPKIYGGTNHHQAFRSQSTVMRQGKLIR